METYERVISAPIFWYNITTLKVSIHMLKNAHLQSLISDLMSVKSEIIHYYVFVIALSN